MKLSRMLGFVTFIFSEGHIITAFTLGSQLDFYIQDRVDNVSVVGTASLLKMESLHITMNGKIWKMVTFKVERKNEKTKVDEPKPV
jgi:hypothetical protein